MKNALLAGCLLAAVPEIGLADDCTGSAPAPVGTWELGSNLSGKMVCIRNGADTDWENQEHHNSNGELWEYAKGAADPVDHSRQIGTWTALTSGAGGVERIQYSYTEAGSFTFDVYRDTAASPQGILFCEDTGTGVVAVGTLQGSTAIQACAN